MLMKSSILILALSGLAVAQAPASTPAADTPATVKASPKTANPKTAVKAAPAKSSAAAKSSTTTTPAGPRMAASIPDPPAKPAPKHTKNPPDWPSWVPDGAVKISDASWRVIENGKPVYYRATAFGFAKLSKDVDDKIQRHIDGNPDEHSYIPENATITDMGDKVRVYYPTPFGPVDYIKEKEKLNAAERAAYEKAKGEKKN